MKLRTLLTRGLECLATVSQLTGEPSLAIQYTTEVLKLEPFREVAYQQLMRLHAKIGNNAEALRVFEQCRSLLREELGASPSPQTEAVFLTILRAREYANIANAARSIERPAGTSGSNQLLLSNVRCTRGSRER